MSAVGATPPRCLAQPQRAGLLLTGLLIVEVEAASWQLRVITGLRGCALRGAAPSTGLRMCLSQGGWPDEAAALGVLSCSPRREALGAGTQAGLQPMSGRKTPNVFEMESVPFTVPVGCCHLWAVLASGASSLQPHACSTPGTPPSWWPLFLSSALLLCSLSPAPHPTLHASGCLPVFWDPPMQLLVPRSSPPSLLLGRPQC